MIPIVFRLSAIFALSGFDKHGDRIICGREPDILILADQWNNSRRTLWENVLSVIELKKNNTKTTKNAQMAIDATYSEKQIKNSFGKNIKRSLLVNISYRRRGKASNVLGGF